MPNITALTNEGFSARATTEDLLNGDPEDDGSPVLATPSREVEPDMDATPVDVQYLGARGEDV